MTQEINLAFINSASQEDFTQLLAEIYEHSSWIPNQAWLQRPRLPELPTLADVE